jgi:hypothetical protein
MRRVAVEPQRGSMKGLWFLRTCIFMALVAGFPWQTQAQTPCPRASQCVPDGVLTITFSVSGDTSGCVFNATVHWGDGVITNVSHIVDGQTMTHTYAAAGVYTVHITGAGTPTSPDALCTFNSHTIVTVQTYVHTRGIAVHIPRVASPLSPPMYPDHLSSG